MIEQNKQEVIEALVVPLIVDEKDYLDTALQRFSSLVGERQITESSGGDIIEYRNGEAIHSEVVKTIRTIAFNDWTPDPTLSPEQNEILSQAKSSSPNLKDALMQAETEEQHQDRENTKKENQAKNSEIRAKMTAKVEAFVNGNDTTLDALTLDQKKLFEKIDKNSVYKELRTKELRDKTVVNATKEILAVQKSEIMKLESEGYIERGNEQQGSKLYNPKPLTEE